MNGSSGPRLLTAGRIPTKKISNCSGRKTEGLKQTPFTTMDPTRQPSAEGVNEFPMSPNVEEVKKSLKTLCPLARFPEMGTTKA